MHTFTLFADRSAKQGAQLKTTWDDWCRSLPYRASSRKDACAVILGPCDGGRRERSALPHQTAVCVDLDHTDVGHTARCLTGIECVLVESFTQGRHHAFFPLSGPVGPTDWLRLHQYLQARLEGRADPTDTWWHQAHYVCGTPGRWSNVMRGEYVDTVPTQRIDAGAYPRRFPRVVARATPGRGETPSALALRHRKVPDGLLWVWYGGDSLMREYHRALTPDPRA